MTGAEDAELAQGAAGALFLGCAGGDEDGNTDQRQDADNCDGPECRTPARGLPKEGAQGYAEDVRRGQAGEHERDRCGLAVRGDEVGGDDSADAEEGTVAQGGHDPSGHHHLVAGRECGQEVADDEQHHQPGQRSLAVNACHRDRERDRADCDGEGVSGDKVAGHDLGDAEVLGDLRQQAHNDELGQPDAEPAQSECEQCEGHGGVLPARRVDAVPDTTTMKRMQ